MSLANALRTTTKPFVQRQRAWLEEPETQPSRQRRNPRITQSSAGFGTSPVALSFAWPQDHFE